MLRCIDPAHARQDGSGTSSRLVRLMVSSVLAVSSMAASAADSASDRNLLGACATAVYREAASEAGRRDPRIVHVLPRGETSTREIGREQLLGVFDGADGSVVGPALDDVHARSAQRWAPPSRITIPGVIVRLAAPRRDDVLGYKDFYLSFWPPGHDEASGTALVLASFGPSPHGGMAACRLQRSVEAWNVVRTWVVSYL